MRTERPRGGIRIKEELRIKQDNLCAPALEDKQNNTESTLPCYVTLLDIYVVYSYYVHTISVSDIV